MIDFLGTTRRNRHPCPEERGFDNTGIPDGQYEERPEYSLSHDPMAQRTKVLEEALRVDVDLHPYSAVGRRSGGEPGSYISLQMEAPRRPQQEAHAVAAADERQRRLRWPQLQDARRLRLRPP